jgi:hypothetical protein
MAKTQIQTTLTVTEFFRIYGVPKYTISKNAELFDWADKIEGCKPKLIDNDKNKRIAAELVGNMGKRGPRSKASYG